MFPFKAGKLTLNFKVMSSIYNIIEQDKSGTGTVTAVKEAFTNYDKAVLTLAMYNRDSPSKDVYYHIQTIELDESEYLISDVEDDKVFVEDENGNAIDVNYQIDHHGGAGIISVAGHDIDNLPISDHLKRMITNDVENAIEWVMSEDRNPEPADSKYDL